jgi:hypothetical protein
MSIQSALTDVNTALTGIKAKNSATQEEAAAIRELESIAQFLQAAQQRPAGATFRQHVQNSPQQPPTMTPSNTGGVDTLQPKAPLGGYHKGNVPPAGVVSPADSFNRDPRTDDNL